MDTILLKKSYSKNWFQKVWNRLFYQYKISIPSCWDELSAAQLLYICKQYEREQTFAKLKIRMINKFLNVPPWVIRNLDPIDMALLTEQLNWIQDGPNITKQLLPEVTIKRVKYIGYADGLRDTSAAAFFLVCRMLYYHKMKTQPDDYTWLRKALAQLYVPLGMEYSYENSIHVERAFESLSKESLIAMHLVLNGALKVLHNEFHMLFEKPIEEGEPNVEAAILAFAGQKFGDFDKTSMQPIWRLLTEAKTKKLEQ